MLLHYERAMHSWQFIPSLLMIGIGMGFVFASLFGAVLNGVDPKHAGAASGILNATQQVGGAIGIAVIGVIFFGQLGHAAPASFETVRPQLQRQLTAQQTPPAGQQRIIDATKRCFVDRSREKDSSVVPPSCRQTGGANSMLGKSITDAAMTANDTNFNRAFKYGVIYEVGLLAVVGALSFALPKRFNVDPTQEVHA